MLGDGTLGEHSLGEIPVDGEQLVGACAHVQMGLEYVVEVQIVESCTIVAEVEDGPC